MTKMKKILLQRPQGALPSNTIPNPREEIKAITTRSGNVLAGPSILPPTPSFEEVEQDPETITDHVLTESTTRVPPLNCSAVLLKKLPEKLGDPGKFLIPCNFQELGKCIALADLGASINLMPLFVWKKLMLLELVPTRMTLELANRSLAYPAGSKKGLIHDYRSAKVVEKSLGWVTSNTVDYDRFAMSSDNSSSAVTYTSVSSDSNGPSSWGIPLENAGKISQMDPYEELDEHVPLYAPEPEHPEHHVPSDDDIQAKDQPYAEDASPTVESPRYIADWDPMEDDTNADSIDYPDESGTDDEDPAEDPSKEHDPEDEDEDPEEDPSEEHEPKDEDAKEDESFKDSDETELFEENKTATTPPPPRHREARISVRPQTPMTAST
ncbi:reverse transcriptase domain-containing protein [Tanacetum coccineum]